MGAGWYYLKVLLGRMTPSSVTFPVLYFLNSEVIVSVVAGILFAMPLKKMVNRWQNEDDRGFSAITSRFVTAGMHGLIFILSLLYLSVNAYNPFIYFRF